MRRAFGVLLVAMFALGCLAQLQVPLGGSSSEPGGRKSTRVTSRTLSGIVLDKSDKPLANAVVYLKNKKTLAVKTCIAQDDGAYRFPELSPNIDYEVYAQKDGKKSAAKTLSSFDDREKANINLRIDMMK